MSCCTCYQVDGKRVAGGCSLHGPRPSLRRRPSNSVPLPIAIPVAQIEGAIAPALEKLAVEISLAGVRRMLVDAAMAVAENRADLEGLLSAVGRLMDHFEPGEERARGIASEEIRKAYFPNPVSYDHLPAKPGTGWIRESDAYGQVWRVLGRERDLILLKDRERNKIIRFSITSWPGPFKPAPEGFA